MPLKPKVTPTSVNNDWHQHQRQHKCNSQRVWDPRVNGCVLAARNPAVAPQPQLLPQPLNPTSPSAAAPVAFEIKESGGCKNGSVNKKLDSIEAEKQGESAESAAAHQQAYLASLAQFVDAHFDAPASDLDVFGPSDWSQELPGWVSELPDPRMADLAAHVHQLWQILYRKASDSAHSHPACHTLLPLPKPFVIPGARFRECYNWDSFWIVRGLLASGLRTTARDLVVNLLSLVDTVGHIPNGARSYYTNRSQPPLISAMVMAASGLSLGGPTPMHVPSPPTTSKSSPTDKSEDAHHSQATHLLSPANHDEGSTKNAESSRHAASCDHERGCTHAALFDLELLQYALPRLVSTWRYWNTGRKVVHVRRRGEMISLCREGKPSHQQQQSQLIQQQQQQRQQQQQQHHEPRDSHFKPHEQQQQQQHPCSSTVHVLSRYYAEWHEPRPESYREDLQTARECLHLHHAEIGHSGSESQQRQLWLDIASAAESGWDFSSRWLADGLNLRTIRTTQIIPVDLNAFLYMLARDIATIAHTLDDPLVAQEYETLASHRLTSLHELMWCERDGCWHDLLLLQPSDPMECIEGQGMAQQDVSAQHYTTTSHRHPATTSHHQQEAAEERAQQPVFVVQQLETCAASNWAPLWAGCCQGCARPVSIPSNPLSTTLQKYTGRAAEAVQGLRASGLLQPGGVMTSTSDTGQQWDAPNAWPPLQHMVIEGLAHSGCPGAQETAGELAGAWLASNWTSYRKTDQMHEKYNARLPGQRGGGGEYTPQVGFGWTNGVVLDLLHQGYTAHP